MASLMSIFDPSMSLMPFIGWLAVALGVLPLKWVYWKSWSTPTFGVKSLMLTLLDIFKTEKAIFVALFLFILNMNILGLLPMVFSPTSHLSFNIVISVALWLGMMLWYVKSNVTQLLVHLTPIGSPIILAPILVLIELVSSLIRPLTLSLRLMANVMAGHMILTLISKGVFSLSVVISLPLLMILTGFMAFEFGVALIQAYVFSSLMSLYWEESESH